MLPVLAGRSFLDPELPAPFHKLLSLGRSLLSQFTVVSYLLDFCFHARSSFPDLLDGSCRLLDW